MRECAECGAPATTAICPRCGAVRPTPTPDATVVPAARSTAVVLPVEDDDDPAALRTSEQPWHPFEQPSWLDAAADPRSLPPGGFRTGDGADFMGISRWEAEPDAGVPAERRRPWLLGALAAVAVVCVLAVVAFFVLRGQRTADSGPTAAEAPTTVAVSVVPESSPAPPSTSASEVPASATTSVPDTTVAAATPTADAAVVDPLGGPQRDIACAPGYVVQIASAGDEASFVARVAELRAAGQLPGDVAVARTASSCAIFAGQSNSIVLYAGPFTDPYQGCEARLGAAPDSFVKGTTPETATEYVSCLCPAQVVTVPPVDTVGQTGVWIGELQRVLGNRLNIPILDLAGNWGTFTTSTAAAVGQFQARVGLPAAGTVDTATWQALQQAQC